MVSSINSSNFLSSSIADLSKKVDDSFNKLSSGKKVNSTKDDAAATAAISLLTSQISGLGQASVNINNAISVSQTAQGALSESTDVLNRIRELSLQAGNDTLSSTDRDAIQVEVDQLTQQFNDVQSNTSFGGQKLLDGSFQNKEIQVGAQADTIVQVNIPTGGSLSAIDVSSTAAATSSLDIIDQALADVSSAQSSLGALETKLSSALDINSTRIASAESSRSQLLDTDFAKETAELTKGLIQQQAGLALLAQKNKTDGNNLLNLLSGFSN